ncbi:hypothetical protein, partial [Streptomyces spiralis]|uniref:hypothetical protein n=1 Tax=Streptomyces spiralis TaxID=66376 RepID=UPI001E4CE9DC
SHPHDHINERTSRQSHDQQPFVRASKTVPRSFDEILDQATVPDTVTEADLDALQQEIVRDVTATLMFGARPAPRATTPRPSTARKPR